MGIDTRTRRVCLRRNVIVDKSAITSPLLSIRVFGFYIQKRRNDVDDTMWKKKCWMKERGEHHGIAMECETDNVGQVVGEVLKRLNSGRCWKRKKTSQIMCERIFAQVEITG